MTVKQICRCVAFLLIGVCLYAAVQEVFTPEWNQNCGCGSAISGFHALEEDSIDAVFVGTSLVACGISPMTIYEDTGISTYNLGTSGQSIQATYFLLKEAFKSQNPKAVFLEPNLLFQKVTSQYNYRIVMDNLIYTATGLEMAREYNNLFQEGMASSLLPMMTYHNRWNELEKKDFHMCSSEPYYAMGYYMVSHTAPIDEDVLDIFDRHIEELDVSQLPEEETRIETYILEYVDKIVELCRQNGAELIIAKLPSFRSVQYRGWNDMKSAAVAALAQQYELDYIDMTPLDLVDYTTDTRDGIHLHIRGAEKASRFLGRYILENIPGVDTSGNEQFDAHMDDYHVMRDVAMLQAENDFAAYLQLLSDNAHRWSFAVAGGGNFTAGLTVEDLAVLEKAGLMKIAEVRPNDNYAAIIHGGEQAYETVSNKFINHTMQLDGCTVAVAAANEYDVAVEEKKTTVSFNHTLYQGDVGLNFLVWDKETGLPLDNKNFATDTQTKSGSSKMVVIKQMLRNFEDSYCFHIA